MNESALIKRTTVYLVARDIWFALLVCLHAIVHYYVTPMTIVLLSILAAGAVLWVLFFTRLIRTVSIARRDKYLAAAFGDEYFADIKKKSGYMGFMAMIFSCLLLILASILIEQFPAGMDIPVYLACEIVLLIGVVANDVTAIRLAGR